MSDSVLGCIKDMLHYWEHNEVVDHQLLAQSDLDILNFITENSQKFKMLQAHLEKELLGK